MTPYLENGGEVVPGVHLVKLPLPFELSLINVYLVRLSEGWLLIDCGIDSAESFAALSSALVRLQIGWREIRQVLVTHVHPDHVGLAPKLLALTGARLLMHDEEVRQLAEFTEPDGPLRHELQALLEDAGTPDAIRAGMEAAFSGMRNSFQRLEPDTRLADGTRIETTLGPLEVVWTPGHSPGHVCLYARERRILFAGDHLLDGITPNIGWRPASDTLDDYLLSLQKVGALEVDLILPSHGAPFRDHRGWIRDTTAHHAERCSRIRALADGGGRTVHELVGGLWDRPLGDFHYRFAAYEVMAHLEYMRRRGEIEAAPGEGALLWRRTGQTL